MPFKSEKQRRYLWANEPEIARDWTDTYGNRIQAFDGGIMELALAQQARQMYALGQLVSKTKDGSRPGYYGADEGHENDPGHGSNAPGGNTGGDPDGRNPMAQFDGSPVSDKGRKGVEDMRAGLRSAISAQNRAAAVDNFKTTLKNIFDKTLIGKGINMLGTKFGKTTAANLADRYGYATDYQGSLGPSSVDDDDDDDMNENRGEGIIPILPKTFTDYYANVDQNLYDDDEETVDDVQDFIQRFRVGDAYRQKPGTIDTPIKYT